MLADFHTHSKFSYDSEAEPLDMLRRAAALGFSHYCFTEHVDFDESYPELPPADIAAYRAAIEPLRESVPGLSVYLGVETSFGDAKCAEATEAHIAGVEWDCIIGSLHHTAKGDPYNPAFYEGKPRLEAYRDYVETIAVRMRTMRRYHILAHIDYIVKYGPYGVPLAYRDAPDAFDTIFRSLAEEGRTLECNTSSQRNPGLPYSGLDLLTRYRELGGEAVSFGSDSHRPEQLGYRFREAHALALEAGIRYQAIYVRGERKLFPLED